MAGGTKGRVLVAMSGGVDSSVTAFQLQSQGYECLGATMYLHDPVHGEAGGARVGAAPGRTCCSLSDIQDAQAVCMRLGIPHEVLDFRDEFAIDVIDKFVRTYRAGRTPNPCIDCNRYLKFDALMDAAEERGCDFVATGHYARIGLAADGTWELRRAADAAKDQSYVLYALTQDRLARTLLPLGGLVKARDVRRIAREQGFINADKRDSQGICFVPDGDFAGFIERADGGPLPEGDILDREGAVIGRHRGAIRYTVGQRKGLGVAAAHPVYVTSVDAAANTVTLGENDELMARALEADDWVWSAPAARMRALLNRAGDAGAPVAAKIRYHQSDQAARMRWADAGAAPGGEGAGAGRAVRLDFDAPQRAIAPGQAVVVYDGDTVLGGGTVRAVL